MYEKVNPLHPDKVADRIAGAIVDLAYLKDKNPRVAVEVLLGHRQCYIIVESSVRISHSDVYSVVRRIAGNKLSIHYIDNEQDAHLANNQADTIRCGDNGIFKGVPLTKEQRELTRIAREIYEWLKAQETGKPVEMCCAIGDECVCGVPYEEMVETAREYIQSLSGFEKFAEWGLIR